VLAVFPIILLFPIVGGIRLSITNKKNFTYFRDSDYLDEDLPLDLDRDVEAFFAFLELLFFLGEELLEEEEEPLLLLLLFFFLSLK
jgi:hypothetical protein